MNKYLAVYGKPRYLGIVTFDGNIEKGRTLIVESVRGEELAVVLGEMNEEQEAAYRQMRSTTEHSDGMVKNSEPVVTDLAFIGFASEEDLATADEYHTEEKSILTSAKELLVPHDLDMKLIDVELLREKRKLFFYFSSDQRVDFRAYVRDLAREFKTRIELRQIGVRDEAKIIRGLGPCGQPCCCSYWLNQFSPVCIKMVKEQNLALNPVKISGICGRLMCCMCYEHEVYHEAWQGFPNPGTKIKTPNGNILVRGIELSSGSLRCLMPGRGEIKIPRDKFDEFKEVVMNGGEWADVQEAEEEEELDSLDIFPGFLHRPEESHVSVDDYDAGNEMHETGEDDEAHADTAGENRHGSARKKKRRPPRHENGASADKQGSSRQEETHKAGPLHETKRQNTGRPQPAEGHEFERKHHHPNRHRRNGGKKTTDGSQPLNTEE